MRLRYFLGTEQGQLEALEAARRDGWLDPCDNVRLYELSRRAFDPGVRGKDAYQWFQRIDDRLTGADWQVCRPLSRADCWPAERIYETLTRDFAEFSWRRQVNLLNFRTGDFRLRRALETIEDIKPKRDFPVMIVSKYLHFYHFYNPYLFPIYDTARIWEQVCNGRFREDYRKIGERENIPRKVWITEGTANYIPFYMRWARSLLSAAHGRFMEIFAKWLKQQCGSNKLDRKNLFATAFEFTIIGAART